MTEDITCRTTRRSSRPGPIRIGIAAIAFALTLPAAGCGPKVRINHNFNPDVDFSKIQSFHWLGIDRITIRTQYEPKSVTRAFKAELRGKGLRELTNADVQVAVYIGITPVTSKKWRYVKGHYWRSEETRSANGLLVVDVIDSATKQLIWRASANGEQDATATPEERERALAQLAKRLFAGLPVNPQKTRR